VTTSPAAWAEAIAGHSIARMTADIGRLVVVAAHPDDETLGAGGFLHAACAAGAQVELVVATEGEAAFGAPSDELGRARRRELHDALDETGLGGIAVHWLGLPDSGLADHASELREALPPLLRDADSCLAPWTGDPHPDHAAVGLAALAVAPVHAHRWAYLIWTLPWRAPDDPDLPWPCAAVFDLDPDTLAAKRRAIRRFTSQLAPAPGGGDPILPADVLAHFDTGYELFFRIPPTGNAPVSRFADLYDAGSDPWQTRTSWYERRKRDVLLACLPRPRYAHVAEPGCGLGTLTAALAARSDRVTASDPVQAAVDAARHAAADSPTGVDRGDVTLLRASLPDKQAVPDDVDLVVLSEVLYYLTPGVVAEVADLIPVGADVVVVHWRGWPAEAPRDAVATHRQLTDDPRFTTLVEHVEEEFLLHVLRRG
jgi:LmbE family N-acetylglucosaminyl deacetylase